MNSLPSPFASTSSLEQGFADGLAAMLNRHPGLGVYILVLANAAYDARLWAQLSPALSTRHAELAAAIVKTLQRGQKLNEPDDDVLVFLKLHAIGFEHLKSMESRCAGPWEVMFNPIRALRPPRSSGMKFESLLRPFDASGFHFNKPFLAREIFWEGELAGKPARMLYNKFPFARLHGLLVPEHVRELPQCLTPELHDWAWKICAESGTPGFCLGYNSYGAGASLNHVHFQSFAGQPATGPGCALCPQRRRRALSDVMPAFHRRRNRLVEARSTAPAQHPLQPHLRQGMPASHRPGPAGQQRIKSAVPWLRLERNGWRHHPVQPGGV